jgi:DNA-binding HxlR family transcriptional regulator
MDSKKLLSGNCPIGRALGVLGDAWTMMILRDASYGMTRFDHFRTSLGIAPNILAKRLSALTEAGLLEKRRYSSRPPRDEYVLTVSGRDFLPVLLAIGAWGGRHRGGGPLSRAIDSDTGAPIDAVVVDRATGRPLTDIAIKVLEPEDQ